MINEPMLVALDGPVSSGKSSLAEAAAKRLNILHLDTGAMYRAVGLCALRLSINTQDETAVKQMIQSGAAQVDIRFTKGKQETLLNGNPVNEELRSQEAGSAASDVSRFKDVRKYLVQRQQEIASHQSMIVDGRDIATVVLPHAKAKIYITAAAQVRAQRRYMQLKVQDPQISYDSVLMELMARDRQDLERENDPLRQAPDAILLDTSLLNFKESVDAIVAIANEAYETGEPSAEN